ncbi:hypothetical protein KCP73_03935 [Salmonella enterica subsp. enterica]|nr:hypothetical protein KCP73_03935 [Salmonella enterica subsp. enterica]
MAITQPRCGTTRATSDLINVAQLTAQYYVLKPGRNAEHAVKFGTSGHRGSAGRLVREPHILAIARAIAEEQAKNGITGLLCEGKTPMRSRNRPSFSVLEVLAANGVDVIVQENNGFTPSACRVKCYLVHITKRRPAG